MKLDFNISLENVLNHFYLDHTDRMLPTTHCLCFCLFHIKVKTKPFHANQRSNPGWIHTVDCWLFFLSLSLSFYYWLEVFNHCCVVCLQVGVVDSPPRVFNSPYSTATSIDYNPTYRMSEFKVCNLVETPFLISMSYGYYFVCFILHFWV